MRQIGQLICTIFIFTFFSNSGHSYFGPEVTVIDTNRIEEAEHFLNRLRNVNELDLQRVFQDHINHYNASADPVARAKELEIILGYAVHMEDRKQILHYAKLQEELGERLKDPTIQLMAKSNLAYPQSLNGQYKSAIMAISDIEKEAIERQDLKLQVHTTMLRGLMASYIGRTLESIERLKAVERLISDDPQYDLQRLLIYWTIAFNAVGNYDIENTMLYYGMSVDIAQDNKWAIDRQSIIYNIASLLENAKAYDLAEKYYHEYGAVSRDVGRDHDIFFMHYGLASLYMEQERYVETYNQTQMATQFENIQVDFQPFLFKTNTLALARLEKIVEAKNSLEQHKEFFIQNPEYKNSRWENDLLKMEAEILRAEGDHAEAYDKYTEFHDNFAEIIQEQNLEDAQGMRQGLETAIAIEEAENNLAKSEIANSYMFLGGSGIILLILLAFYIVQKKSAMQLKKSKAEADYANEAKSTFLANVSHELRTPLNAIIGFSDIMKTERHTPVVAGQTEEYSKLINDAGKHLLSIINDILDINKIEAGKMEMNEDAIDVSWLLDDINHLLGRTAMQANIELSFKAANALPELYGDERQIKQILINLVNNSIKFSEPQTVIRTSAHLRDDKGITIKVEDQGQGMSSDDLQRAMEPFMQIQNTVKSEKEGTGLGLPLARYLTELHGGTMHLSSVLGQGTLIELNFPPERALQLSAP